MAPLVAPLLAPTSHEKKQRCPGNARVRRCARVKRRVTGGGPTPLISRILAPAPRRGPDRWGRSPLAWRLRVTILDR